MNIVERAKGVNYCEVIVGKLMSAEDERVDIVFEDKEYTNGCKTLVSKIVSYVKEHPEEIDAHDYKLVVGFPETKDKLKVSLNFTGENFDEKAYSLFEGGLLASILTFVSANYEGEYDQTREFLEDKCCEAISEYNVNNPYL